MQRRHPVTLYAMIQMENCISASERCVSASDRCTALPSFHLAVVRSGPHLSCATVKAAALSRHQMDEVITPSEAI